MTANPLTAGPLSLRPRWHYVYFLLAGCNLLAIALIAYLNHRLTSLYDDAQQVNRAWEARQDEHLDLLQLAAAVNAPGNDVFETRDPAGESRRMHAALRRFNQTLESVRDDLRDAASQGDTKALLHELTKADAGVQEMAVEAEQIFIQFRRNEPDKAGPYMAAMDRRYDDVRGALINASREVNLIQSKALDDQVATADSLARLEWLIAGLTVLSGADRPVGRERDGLRRRTLPQGSGCSTRE
jgi:hypothetical protein